jgi:hypothetical protein
MAPRLDAGGSFSGIQRVWPAAGGVLVISIPETRGYVRFAQKGDIGEELEVSWP